MTGYAGDNIVISVFLQSLPGPTANFQSTLFMVDEAQGTGNGLDGDRYRSYGTTADLDADEALGYISAEVKQAGYDYFAQPGRKKTLLIGRMDSVGGEAYDTAYDLVIAAGANFYGVAADTRTPADQVLMYDAVEADDFLLFVFQSSDADWLTGGGFPVAYTSFSGVERTAILYHDTDTEWSDLAWLGRILEFDPDNQSAPWSNYLGNVLAYTSTPDASEKSNAQDNNANLGLALGSKTFWIDRGVTGEGSGTTEGRPIDHIVSVDWFVKRLEEDLINFKIQKADIGEKIPVNAIGQKMILGLIEKRLEQGISAGHFQPQLPTDDTVRTEAEARTIITADITNKRLRFRVQVVWVTGAIEFIVDVYARAA